MLKELFHHLKVLIFGTSAYEMEWETRTDSVKKHCGDWDKNNGDWIAGYWTSINHPHRKFLTDIIIRSKPDTVLEVGCNCGPNLRLLTTQLPGSSFTGIDINPETVLRGTEWFKNEGIFSVTLLTGKADDLSPFPDKSFDIIFTDAVLLYIGPDKIDRVINEMIRVTRKKIILLEWQSDEEGIGPRGTFVYQRGLWVRNYKTLFQNKMALANLTVTKMSKELWNDALWQRYGAAIEIDLVKNEMR